MFFAPSVLLDRFGHISPALNPDALARQTTERELAAQESAQAARGALHELLEHGRGSRALRLGNPLVFSSFAIAAFCFLLSAALCLPAFSSGAGPVPQAALVALALSMSSFMLFFGFFLIRRIRAQALDDARADPFPMIGGPARRAFFSEREARLREELLCAEEACALSVIAREAARTGGNSESADQSTQPARAARRI